MLVREATARSLTDCKKCLVETNGDVEEAIKYANRMGDKGIGWVHPRPTYRQLVQVHHATKCNFKECSDALVKANFNTDNAIEILSFKNAQKNEMF